jgi:hypothetical protein
VDEFVKVTRGVWRPAGLVADVAGRAAALLTAAPEGTVIGGFAAARLHGLWIPDTASERIELLLRRDVAVPEAHSHSKRPELIGRRRRLVADEVELIDGLPVTTAARTWVDLGERLSLPDLVAVGDSVLRGSVSLDDLEVVVKRATHRRGIVRVRTALPLLDARSRSRPESHLRYTIVAAGLPKPAVNEAIYDVHVEWLAESDLSYDDVRLAIEYNGPITRKSGGCAATSRVRWTSGPVAAGEQSPSVPRRCSVGRTRWRPTCANSAASAVASSGDWCLSRRLAPCRAPVSR